MEVRATRAVLRARVSAHHALFGIVSAFQIVMLPVSCGTSSRRSSAQFSRLVLRSWRVGLDVRDAGFTSELTGSGDQAEASHDCSATLTSGKTRDAHELAIDVAVESGSTLPHYAQAVLDG